MACLVKLGLDTRHLPAGFTLCVRWYATKPRWAPPAKTKQFRVNKRPQEEIPGEFKESRRLYNVYNSQLKASLEVMKNMYRESEVSQEVIDAQEKEKEDYWQESLRINEDWNRQIAIEREELDRQEFEKEVAMAQEKMRQVDEENRKEQERIDKMIREQEELSKTFITREQLDEHVTKILNSEPHSFNYALDVEGNVYDDYSPVPTRKVTESGEFIPLITEEETKRSRPRRRG